MTERLVLHEYAASGNCYKVRLTAAILGRAPGAARILTS